MRKLLLATAAVAMVGFADTSRADSVDLPLADMEAITAGAYSMPSPYYAAHFNKSGLFEVKKYVDVLARFHVKPEIYGNYADGEASATAFGTDTFAQTFTAADTVAGYMSQAGSHSMSAVASPYVKYHHPPKVKRY